MTEDVGPTMQLPAAGPAAPFDFANYEQYIPAYGADNRIAPESTRSLF